MATFNLLTEPWIPAMDQSGNIKEQGILDTLREAHLFSEISDPSPLVQFGIYRLLIAFVMDALELKNEARLISVIERKQFDMDAISVYANRWKNRFDLFDAEHPFMQSVPDLSIEKEKTPIHSLFQHISPSHNNQFLCHDAGKSHAFSFEQCAKGLITLPAFMTVGGRGYSPSINGSPPLYVLIKGDNLFQTILYNCCVIDPIVKPIGNEPPAWRSETTVRAGAEVNQFSLLEGLTWRPRRIRILPGEGGVCTYTGRAKDALVREMYFGSGLKASGDWADPQVAYKFTSRGRSPIRSDGSRDPWRDIGPLTLLNKADFLSVNGKTSFEKPAVITQYMKTLLDFDVISPDKPFIVELYGLRTEVGKMKLFEWTVERLSLPWGVFRLDNAGKLVQDAMDYTDIVAGSIRFAIKKAYARDSQKSTDNLDCIIEKATYAYWSSIKPLFMESYLKELSGMKAISPSDPDAPQILLGKWKETIIKMGATCLDISIDPLDTKAKDLEDRVKALRLYRGSAYSQLYPDKRKPKSKKGGKQTNE